MRSWWNRAGWVDGCWLLCLQTYVACSLLWLQLGRSQLPVLCPQPAGSQAGAGCVVSLPSRLAGAPSAPWDLAGSKEMMTILTEAVKDALELLLGRCWSMMCPPLSLQELSWNHLAWRRPLEINSNYFGAARLWSTGFQDEPGSCPLREGAAGLLGAAVTQFGPTAVGREGLPSGGCWAGAARAGGSACARAALSLCHSAG